MARIKVRCGRCSKKFNATSAKQTFCPECEAKLRAERTASKSVPAKTIAATATSAPKIVGPGASILVPGMVATAASAPPEPSELGLGRGASYPRDGQSGAPRDGRAATGATHGPSPKPGAQTAKESRSPRPGQGKEQHGEHTHQPKAARPPREPKAPRQAPPAFELTDEMRAKIEQRYLELAQPVEFDGIRTQIAGELTIPKALVKKAVIDLRTRMQMPSWWELQTYTGGNTDLDRIRRAYVPHLPIPPIGIHKTLAQELALDTGVVYQGIKRIRAEMRLPRFNPPELHEGEADAGAQTGTDAPQSTAAPAVVADVGGVS
ncbi:MAG TPA: hypothetical protein VKQ30_16675 [Ktedonobacterales bacterium]|nr:hypothetical protein [Ktedonobacterales bacterium]